MYCVRACVYKQIVMEYMGAGSVSDLMAICDRQLTEDQIAVVLKMSILGLEYLHKMHKIHRDIKSGNILLNHDGDCKLGELCVCVCMRERERDLRSCHHLHFFLSKL